MTALLTAEFEDETGATRRLTRDEVLTYTQVLAGAGNETTGRLIGWLAKVLAEHPDQRRELVADRSLIPNAIDETLRFEPTGPHIARYVAQDVEYYGTTVPAGSAMLLLVGVGQPRRAPLRATPTGSTSTAPTASTSRSATGCTSASAPTWPASRAASRSTSCSTGSPSGRSTSARPGSRRPRPSAGWDSMPIVVGERP